MVAETRAWRLWELREQVDLTQVELAAELQVSRNRVSRIERGDLVIRPGPSPQMCAIECASLQREIIILHKEVAVGRQEISMRPYARDAALLMGANVRIARANRNWTAAELAARAGCSRRTISSIEHGRAEVSVGHVFNVCAVLGLPLFRPDPAELARMSRDAQMIVSLIPARVVPDRQVNDDF